MSVHRETRQGLIVGPSIAIDACQTGTPPKLSIHSKPVFTVSLRLTRPTTDLCPTDKQSSATTAGLAIVLA